MKYELTAENVSSIFGNSLYREGEDTSEAKIHQGVTIDVGFHPERLFSHVDEIVTMLEELPDEFVSGWSFLNACTDKHGRQWGEQKNAQELVMLGVGVGLVKLTPIKAMWSIMPGGVPYLRILKKGVTV